MSAGRPPVLLTSGQSTSTGELLARAAVRRGFEHVVLRGPETLPALAGRSVHWYGGPLAADRFAAGLGLGLLEPSDAWLAELPQEFTGRRIELTTLSEAWTARRPVFVKPPGDKQFPAGVYADGTRLPRTGERLFVLDGEPLTASRYARYGRLDVGELAEQSSAVRSFAARLLAERAETLPSAVALDVGLLQDPDTGREAWAVVEANMPWFAHSYAADPDRVLDVVLRASGPSADFTEHDRRFLR